MDLIQSTLTRFLFLKNSNQHVDTTSWNSQKIPQEQKPFFYFFNCKTLSLLCSCYGRPNFSA